MDVIAHRGLWHAAPENSLAAVSAAITAGLTLIEVDVRATRDGVPFLLHDATLERTTQLGGRLTALTAGEAARARLADGAPLPRLEAALELAHGRAVLCLDVKDRRVFPALATLVRGREEEVEVWSADREVVRQSIRAGVRAVLISTGLMARGIGGLIWAAWEAGATGLSFYPADLEPHVAAACRNARMPFLCGVPNDIGTWRYLLNAGARAAITDRPLHCRAWLAGTAALGRARSDKAFG